MIVFFQQLFKQLFESYQTRHTFEILTLGVKFNHQSYFYYSITYADWVKMRQISCATLSFSLDIGKLILHKTSDDIFLVLQERIYCLTFGFHKFTLLSLYSYFKPKTRSSKPLDE